MALPKQRQEAPARNTGVVELEIKQLGVAVNTITGTVDVYDEEADALVPTGTGLTLAYVAASAGMYRAIAPDDVFTEGVRYRCDCIGDDSVSGAHFEAQLWAYGVIPDILP